MSTVASLKRSQHGRHTPKVALLTRDSLDKRTRAARQFDQIASSIISDMGGRDRISSIELSLIEGFAGAALHLRNINARLMLGEEINLSEHATAISSLVRIASRIGTGRRPRDVTPTLQEYLRLKDAEHDEAEVDE